MEMKNYDEFAESTFTLGELQRNKQNNTKKKGKKGKKGKKNPFITTKNHNLLDASEHFRHAAEYHASTKKQEYEYTQEREISQPTAAEPDSLIGYSDLLQQKVDLINVDNKLYFHSGKCYLPLNKRELIRLYRQKVDYTLHNATTLSHISPLYNFLLSDPNIITEAEENQHLCTLENGVYDVILIPKNQIDKIQSAL